MASRNVESRPLLGGEQHHTDSGTNHNVLDKPGLHWSNVTLDVGTGSGTKRILDDCTGSVYPGEVTCIIGPSGAGKTTLFNTLCGKTSKGVSSNASIHLDGSILTRDRARRSIAYVTQEDAMFATVTPREALTFSARLRLPASTSDDTITELVEQMISMLGLEKCANTLIGNQIIRGVSGGEKKRTAIGVELITQPSTVFLDEPTSGLDSYAALGIIKLLRQLADQGCTVLCTIHQPSSEIFEIFDKVLLLAQGRMMYGGANAEMVEHFEALGYKCPPNHNPADYMLFLMQTESNEKLLTIERAWRNKAEAAAAQGSVTVTIQGTTSKESVVDAGIDDTKTHRLLSNTSLSQKSVLVLQDSTARRPGFFRQLGTLIAREMRNVRRDKAALVARFGLTAFLNLFFAFIFTGAGTAGTDCPGAGCAPNIRNHFGALVQLAIGLMFGAAQPTLLAFPLERPTFLREYGTATYGVSAYFLSKTIVEMLLTFLTSCVVFLVPWKIMDLQGDIIFLIFAAFALSLVANSMALVMGCALSSVKVALELSPLIFVPQILFSGVFITIDQIPTWLRWAQYACSLKFAVNIMAVVEFNDNACNAPQKYLTNQTAEVQAETQAAWRGNCEEFLDMQDIHVNKWPVYAGILADGLGSKRFALRTLSRSPDLSCAVPPCQSDLSGCASNTMQCTGTCHCDLLCDPRFDSLNSLSGTSPSFQLCHLSWIAVHCHPLYCRASTFKKLYAVDTYVRRAGVHTSAFCVSNRILPTSCG
eukprot:m.574731 g.574731  ORF g.574731 m.574731 type:complete len:761 (+) comp22282_c0_seq4:105-2387(+)